MSIPRMQNGQHDESLQGSVHSTNYYKTLQCFPKNLSKHGAVCHLPMDKMLRMLSSIVCGS
jgi:hypothetical protein